MLRIITGLLLMVLLVGCAPQTEVGFSTAQWQQMPSKAREEVLANYRKIKQQSPVPQQIYDGPEIGVYLLKGEAVMPPFFDRLYAFQTKYFEISPGVCKWLILQSIDTDHSTTLQVCYDGLKLVMDPSRYELDKRHGTVQFDYNPIWKRGFTYDNVSTTGYARLSHLQVSIKALPKKVAGVS